MFIDTTWYLCVLSKTAYLAEIWWPSWLLWGRFLLLQPPHLARQNGNSFSSVSSLVLQIGKLYKLPQFLGVLKVPHSHSLWNLKLQWLKTREIYQQYLCENFVNVAFERFDSEFATNLILSNICQLAQNLEKLSSSIIPLLGNKPKKYFSPPELMIFKFYTKCVQIRIKG